MCSDAVCIAVVCTNAVCNEAVCPGGIESRESSRPSCMCTKVPQLTWSLAQLQSVSQSGMQHKRKHKTSKNSDSSYHDSDTCESYSSDSDSNRGIGPNSLCSFSLIHNFHQPIKDSNLNTI